MTRWRPQPFRTFAEKSGHDPVVIDRALATAAKVLAIVPDAQPVFTLRHLAHLVDGDYGALRALVGRNEPEPYRLFRIRKRPAFPGEVRYRIITVPSPQLMRVQRLISQSILAKATAHPASVAFSKGDRIFDAANAHRDARWLIKMDVRNFFESINEIAVYRVFRSLGYQPLISFELARLCTRLSGPSALKQGPKWRQVPRSKKITAYNVRSQAPQIGSLPQGAPTSPMLANLAMRAFDKDVQAIAHAQGLRYTRYADDLTFSTPGDFDRARASHVIGLVSAAMGRTGLSPNMTKTRVRSPGARKIVLGLQVGSAAPRLPREFKEIMRRHIHYCVRSDVGPVMHARARGFSSVRGFRNHLEGLLGFAKQIEPLYAAECKSKLATVVWPF
jgi:RNA-directed DNA polymerase